MLPMVTRLLSIDDCQQVNAALECVGAAPAKDLTEGLLVMTPTEFWQEINAKIKEARDDQRQMCADMARAHARAISKGTFKKPASAEEWGEIIAKHIEIPF